MNPIFNVICRFLNILLSKYNPELGKEELLEITKRAVEEHGWKFRGPCYITTHIGYYVVRTNTHFRGGNAVIKIDSKTGEVLRKGFIEY